MTFSKKEAFSFSWKETKENIGKLVGITLIYLLIQIVVSSLADILSADGSFAESLLTFASWLVSFFLTMGYIRVFLNLIDKKEFDIITLFEERQEFWNFVGVGILQMLIVMIGLVLLVIPGFYWGLKYSQASYLVIDKGLKPIEALKESAKLMEGVKWNYLLFSIIIGLINIAGLIVFGIGLLVTLPLSNLAVVYVYRELNEHSYGVTVLVDESKDNE